MAKAKDITIVILIFFTLIFIIDAACKFAVKEKTKTEDIVKIEKIKETEEKTIEKNDTIKNNRKQQQKTNTSKGFTVETEETLKYLKTVNSKMFKLMLFVVILATALKLVRGF